MAKPKTPPAVPAEKPAAPPPEPGRTGATPHDPPPPVDVAALTAERDGLRAERDALAKEKADAAAKAETEAKAAAEARAAKRAAAEAEVKRRYELVDPKVRERIGATTPVAMLTALRTLEASAPPPAPPRPAPPGFAPPSGLGAQVDRELPTIRGITSYVRDERTGGLRRARESDLRPMSVDAIRPREAAEQLGIAGHEAKTR